MRRLSTDPAPPDTPGCGVAASTVQPSGPAASSPFLARLRIHAALPATDFQRRFLDPVERLAALLASAAAQPRAEYTGTGPEGRLTAGIEAAFLCFQASDGRIFTGREGVEARHRLEVRWRYLCFAAGLLRGAQEPGFLLQGAALAPVIGAPNMHWLDAGGPRLSSVLHQITGCCTGASEAPVTRFAPHQLDAGAAHVERLVARVLEALRAPGPPRVRTETARLPALPPDLEARVRDPLQRQRLADLAAACRAHLPNGSPAMVRTEDFLVLALDFVVPIVRDLPRWVEAMAGAGLIHCPPETPGLRVVPWVFTPGVDARPAIVLSALACRRLAL